MKKFFTSLLKKPIRRYCLVFLIVIGVFCIFPEGVFAQLASKGQSSFLQEAQKDGYVFLVNVINLLSWLWIVPATLAGSLLSNSLAYGKPFFLDRYLFMMRQMMRTFSLFALGFLFLGQILKNFIKLGDPKEYFQIIKRTVLAGFLISMSWFVLAALIDLSIIATSAVASVPLVVMQDKYESLQGKITCRQTITVEKFGATDQLFNTTDEVTELNLEDIMPKGDSVSGPLVFLGCAMMKLDNTVRADPNDLEWKEFLSLGLKLIVNLMMVMPMIVLMVVNMMRIFFIRLWAMFMPVIVLDQVFKGPLSKSESVGKYFDPKNIFGLIFQPVAVVAALSIGIILILGIYDANVGGTNAEQAESMERSFNLYQNNDITQVGSGATGLFFVEGTILEQSTERVGGVIGELIMTGFIIVILWVLVKVGFATNDITKSAVDSMYKYGTQLAKSVPFVPTGFGAQSIGSLQMGGNQFKQAIKGSFAQKQSAEAGNLNRLFGINDENALTPEQVGLLESTAGRAGDAPATQEEYLRALKSVQSERDVGVTEIRSTFETWLGSGGLGYIGSLNGFNSTAIAAGGNTELNTLWNPGAGSTDEINNRNVQLRGFLDAVMSTTSNTFRDLSPRNSTGNLQTTYNQQN